MPAFIEWDIESDAVTLHPPPSPPQTPAAAERAAQLAAAEAALLMRALSGGTRTSSRGGSSALSSRGSGGGGVAAPNLNSRSASIAEMWRHGVAWQRPPAGGNASSAPAASALADAALNDTSRSGRGSGSGFELRAAASMNSAEGSGRSARRLPHDSDIYTRSLFS